MSCEKHLSSNVIGVDLYNQTMTGGVSKTLNNRATDSDHVPCVLVVENHPADSRCTIKDDGICQALTSRMGTGGGNVPLVLIYEETVQQSEECPMGEADCMHDAMAGGGASMKSNLVSNASAYVRRLTPLQCERLQGYPDGWTDIGEWTDR